MKHLFVHFSRCDFLKNFDAQAPLLFGSHFFLCFVCFFFFLLDFAAPPVHADKVRDSG